MDQEIMDRMDAQWNKDQPCTPLLPGDQDQDQDLPIGLWVCESYLDSKGLEMTRGCGPPCVEQDLLPSSRQM